MKNILLIFLCVIAFETLMAQSVNDSITITQNEMFFKYDVDDGDEKLTPLVSDGAAKFKIVAEYKSAYWMLRANPKYGYKGNFLARKESVIKD